MARIYNGDCRSDLQESLTTIVTLCGVLGENAVRQTVSDALYACLRKALQVSAVQVRAL